MSLIRQVCPECGDDWTASRMMPCGRCLEERGEVVQGVRAKPPHAEVAPETARHIAEVTKDASRYTT